MALSLGQKVGWGLADTGINVFVVIKQLLVFTFLTAFLGVPPGVAGWVTFAVLAFDVVTDPLVGFLSDRTNSRWGRRAPWIFVGAVILAVGIVGMFAVPEGMIWQSNMTWVIGFFGLATIGFTFVAVPYGAMAGEMSQDPRERSTMMAFRMTFASIGLLLAGALVPALAGDTRQGYANAVLLVAPFVVLAIWAMLFFTRNAPKLTAPSSQSFAQILGLVVGNRAFIILVALYGLLTLGVAMIAAGLQLAALYLITDTGDSMLSGLAGALGIFSVLFAMFIIGSVLSQFCWVKASAWLGKTWALVVGMVLYILVLLLVGQVLPATGIGTMALLFLATGFTNGAYQQIPWAMYPDLMDVTRNATGQAIEGAFSAVWLFGQKVANAIAPLILGLVLSRADWKPSTQGKVDQSAEALQALETALTLWPAALFALSIIGLIAVYRPATKRLVAHG